MKAKMSKKSTLTITIMACLLAVAVATTIVLAAFTANKQATTTVTFANGVQIKINGAYRTENTAGQADPLSRVSDVTLLWACTEGTQAKNTTSGALTGVSSAVVFDAITFTNGPATGDGASAPAYLVAKPSIACTSASPTSAQTTAASSALSAALATALDTEHSGASATWVPVGTHGWYVYSADSTNITTTIGSSAVLTTLAVDGTANFLSSTTLTSNPIDNLAGATFTAIIKVYAVNAAAADAIDSLNTIVAAD